MPQHDGAGIHLPDEIDKFFPVGVSGQVEILHAAATGQFPGAITEMKRISGLRRL